MVLDKQPESMVVVGSGAIGSEFAYFLSIHRNQCYPGGIYADRGSQRRSGSSQTTGTFLLRR